MRITLTKRLVAQAQPQPKPYEMSDILVRGLILRVQPSGHKAWVVTWQHGKRRAWYVRRCLIDWPNVAEVEIRSFEEGFKASSLLQVTKK
ncbi:Arm DNA-binding domain-containing protein [Pseudoxanthomonas winnipegensis]|uniref:DUF4102 domain-containing protein n=1 Tax=Pseudoxanthomonas winnipegensis TaxID=2480810 RepID=A0A4Q8LX53_9GAMM|nr:Arm DNA-binding domain-containing protein [Pseudoxanthomonas winnipegensis]RZZ90771.1 DUF4102 domain-containing protein [Pseudoxanthomonas winnipegensis]TAA36119.1 DUF4102 domain-containing protein [Pseudoxanthomonas winnipegensis]